LTLTASLLLYALWLIHCQQLFSCVDELNAIALILESAWRRKCHPSTIFALFFICGRTSLPGLQLKRANTNRCSSVAISANNSQKAYSSLVKDKKSGTSQNCKL